MAIALANVRPTAPAEATDGSILFDITGSAGTANAVLYVDNNGNNGAVVQSLSGLATPGTDFALTNLASGSYQLVVFNTTTPGQNSGAQVVVPLPPPAVVAAPPSPGAAHLPLLLTLQAAPQLQSGGLTPRVLLVVAEVLQGADWVTVGRELTFVFSSFFIVLRVVSSSLRP